MQLLWTVVTYYKNVETGIEHVRPKNYLIINLIQSLYSPPPEGLDLGKCSVIYTMFFY